MILLSLLLQLSFSGEIQIKSLTYLSSQVIRLQDIASFKDVDVEKQKKLGSLVLAEDLKVGVSREFSRSSLVDILKRYQPKADRITFVIPEVAVVKRQEDRFSKENVERHITSELQKNYKGSEVQVETSNFPAIGDEVVDWEVVLPSQSQSSFLLVNLKYTIKKEGREIERSTGLHLKVKILQEVPVVKNTLFRGDRIQIKNIQMKHIEVPRNQFYITSISDLEGRKLKRNLRPGDPIRSTDLEKDYSVLAGQSVKLLVIGKDIKVSSEGIAKQNGVIGDVIRVTNPMNNRLVFGTVTGAAEVEIK